MPKYLSGRAKQVPQAALSSDRYRFLALDQAEPNFSNPSTLGIADGGSSVGIPVGTKYQLVTIHGDTSGSRYWQPVGGGIIPGSISVYEEGIIVGTANSITQLDFIGNVVTASGLSLNPRATLTFRPPGDNSSVLFKESDDFATSSKLVFNSSAGILTATNLNIGIGGTVITATSNSGVSSVGIGTTNPTQLLHVGGNLRLTGTIYDGDNFEGATGDLIVKALDGSLEWKAPQNVNSGAGGTISEIQYHDDTGLVDGAPNFVWIESTQRIGIGSTQPRTLLDVVGIASFSNVEVSGVSTTYGLLDINGGGQANTFKVEDLTNNRLVIAGVGGELEDSANLTYDGVIFDVIGRTELDNVNISGVGTIGDVRIESNTIDTNSGNLILDSSGGTIQAQDIFFINNSTDSSDPDSGALQVNGGVGINKNVNIGAGITVTGLSTFVGLGTFIGDLWIGGDLYVNQDLIIDAGSFQRLLVNPGIATFKGDVEFHGNSSDLKWDKSADALEFKDETQARFGNNNDLKISHTRDLASQTDSNGDLVLDGDNWCSYIEETGTGPLIFKTDGGPGSGAYQFYDTAWRPILKLFSGTSARAALYYAGSEKLITTSTGIDITGISEDDGAIHNGNVQFYGGAGIASVTWDKFGNSLEFADDTKCIFGNSEDFSLYHDGTNNYIDFKTNNLYIRGNTLTDSGSDIHLQATKDKDSIVCWDDEGVSIFYNDGVMLDVVSDGVEVSGVTSTTSLNVLGIATFLGAVHDKDGEAGNNGNLLESTVTGVNWVSPGDLTVRNADRVRTVGVTTDSTYYLTFVEDNNTPTGQNEGVYTGVGVTFNANTNHLTVGGSFWLKGSDSTDGDIFSEGGDNSIFGIYNNTNSGELALNVKDSGGTNIGIATFRGNKSFFDSNVSPKTHDTYDLGESINHRWKTIYAKNYYADEGEFNRLIVTGVSTFNGAIDANSHLDVDGQTELDDVNIAGVSTFVGIASFYSGLRDKDGDKGDALQLLQSTGSQIVWADPDSIVIGEADRIRTQESTTDASYYLTFVTDNNSSGTHYEQVFTGAGITFSPNTSSLGIAGNVSIGGTLTYEDVTNIDSIGLVTARSGLRVLSGGINAAGFSTFTGITTVSGSVLYTNQLSVAGLSTFAGHILPSEDDTYDVGSTTKRWRNVYAQNLGIGTDTSESIFTKSGNFNGTDQVIDDDPDASTADLLEYTIFFELNSDSTKIQSGKANIMCNGTSSYISEYGIMYNNTRIANLSTDVNGGNIRLLGTSTAQVNYKLVRRTLS